MAAMVTIGRRYHFESAHHLPRTPESHKCHRVHGHNYTFEVILRGEIDEQGWLIDFWDIDAIVHPIVETIDHRCLNDIEELENPTAEVISHWLRNKIATGLEASSKGANVETISVKVWETPDAYASSSILVMVP